MEELNSHLPYTLSFSQNQDREEDLAYYTQRAADIATFLATHRSNLQAYIDFCEQNAFIPDEAAYEASEQITTQMAATLAQLNAKLATPPPAGPAYYTHVTECERLYRTLLLLKVPAVRLLSWGSSAYAQTVHTFHFQPSQYGGLGDRFNYDRTDSPDLIRWRNQTKEVLGLTPAQGLVAVASGTAAFTVVFDYLIQRVLTPNFHIYAPRMVYGETDLLMREDSALYTFTLDNFTDAAAIASRIRQLQPDVILLEGMRNAQGNPLVDIPALAAILNQTTFDKDIHLLVDDTLLSGAYVVGNLVTNPRVKVFQYLSTLKYLQLGMDSGFSGAVIMPEEQEAFFRKWASWLGLVLYDSVALTYPSYTREQFIWRQRRQTRNAYAMAHAMQQAFGNTGLQALHPLQATHPHFAHAITLPYTGALLTLDVTAITGRQVSEKNLKPLTTLLDKILAAAKRRGLNLAASESFGLGTPRITVNWCKRTPPYLRLSAGDRSLDETTAIAHCIAEELLRHLPAKA